jgi:sporulation protein YlmC with PRC-barrel domain
MAHCGCLGNQSVPADVHDIRGTTIRGADGEKLGTVNDVIFDHDTMEMRYLVVDSEGWLEAGTFLLPAHSVYKDTDHNAGLATPAGKQHIQNAPNYDQESLKSSDEWGKYERDFKKYWEEDPVLHMKGSDRIITPPEEPGDQASSASQETRPSGDGEINAADLFPERMTKVFTDTEPGSSKITMRPQAVARDEDAASGVALLKPRWWDAFENYLNRKRDDIQSRCPQCASKGQKAA